MGDGGPKALRDRNHPWGLPDAPPAGWEQLEVGNLLLRFTLLLAQASILARILGVGEHPATCHWRPQAASIWRLEEIQRLKAQGARGRL